MHKRAALALGALIALQCSSAPACTYRRAKPDEKFFLKALIDESDQVVHGRVVRLLHSPGRSRPKAEIEVIRSFKGAASKYELTSGGGCGASFAVGEEAIYFIDDGRVVEQSVYVATKPMLRSLAELQWWHRK